MRAEAGSAEDRALGAFLGLAVGDALGAPLEFKAPGTFAPITGMVGGGVDDLPAGCWTDDTSLALCLAKSLAAKGGFDERDQMERYAGWYLRGENSSTGRAFGVGKATKRAIERYLATGDPVSGPHDQDAAGNGSLMRLAPVAIYYRATPALALEFAARSSLVTHGSPVATDACRYLAALLIGVLGGETRESLLHGPYSPSPGIWESAPLAPEIAEIAEGSFLRREPPVIRASGYAARTLEAALWAFNKGRTFEEALLLAVNLGDDSDTVGAVCGQLAGAFYGLSAIPPRWLENLFDREGLSIAAKALLQA